MLQYLVQGILLGGLYAIIGVGMSMVFGVMKLTNLAHGDLMILSSYLALVYMQIFNSLLLATALTIISMVIVGFLIQNFLVNKVLDKGSEPALLIMFGVSVFLANLLHNIFSADYRGLSNSLANTNVITTEAVKISGIYFLSFVVAIVMIVGLHFVLQKTNFGRSIRATSDNKMAAELMGLDTKKAYSLAMMLSMGVTAVSGVLIGCTYSFNASVGSSYLIVAFGVVVIGGMGSLIGTLLGGIVLGLSQLLGSYFAGSGFQMLIAYVVLLIILATRPNGLLARGARK
jgi:branched-chain amino acid transport system permease protein